MALVVLVKDIATRSVLDGNKCGFSTTIQCKYIHFKVGKNMANQHDFKNAVKCGHKYA